MCGTPISEKSNPQVICEDNMPTECIFEEIYYFLYNPKQGFGVQLLYTTNGRIDEAYRVQNDESLNSLAAITIQYSPRDTKPIFCG